MNRKSHQSEKQFTNSSVNVQKGSVALEKDTSENSVVVNFTSMSSFPETVGSWTYFM